MRDACPFCSNPDNQARCIIRNELVWALPTNSPVVPGHVLIVPVRHVATFAELSADERTALFEMQRMIMNALRKSFGAQGFNIAWNEDTVAGQSIPHFHMHVLPRKQGDTGITEYEPRKFLYRPGSREVTSEGELRAVADAIRAKIDI